MEELPEAAEAPAGQQEAAVKVQAVSDFTPIACRLAMSIMSIMTSLVPAFQLLLPESRY